MAASPSEFLTFYRRMASSTIGRRSLGARQTVARPFSSTLTSRLDGHSEDTKHATRKDDGLNIQSNAVKSGSQSKAEGTGGHATQEKDVSGSVEKTKREHPEAPDPAIGMQDERGGKA